MVIVVLLTVKINPETTLYLEHYSSLPDLNIHFPAVEQGIHELRKLGIEQLLWELSRHELNLAKDDPSDVEDLTQFSHIFAYHT